MNLHRKVVIPFSVLMIGLVWFGGDLSAQKVGDPIHLHPVRMTGEVSRVLITSGTITMVDAPGLRVCLKCDKPFWGPLGIRGSDAMVLWPTAVQLAVWVKAAPMTIGGKKAHFGDFAVGQRVTVQYILEYVNDGLLSTLNCFARRIDIVPAQTNKR